MALTVLRRRQPVDEVAALAGEIAAAEAEIAAAKADAERLVAEEAVELDDERAEALWRDARAAERRGKRAERSLTELRERQRDAVLRQRQAAFSHHKRALAVAAQAAIAAVEKAAIANAAALKARDDAVAELGNVAEARLPRLAFVGILLPDLVATWRIDVERQLEAMERQEYPSPAPVPGPPRPLKPGELPAGGIVDAPRRVILAHGTSMPADADPEKYLASISPSGPRPAPRPAVNPTPATPPRARQADDTAPLEAGQVRARVIRSGYTPADDRPQCDGGQIIRLPAAAAEKAVKAGAVEITERGPDA